MTCTLFPAPPPADTGMLKRLARLKTSYVSDAFDRWAGAPGLRPMAGLKPGKVVVGPAFTVRTRPGDNLVLHKALDLAVPGDIVVVAGGGAEDRALFGGLMGLYAATKNIAAIVIDGAVRDLSELEQSAPPVFARAVSHLGPYKDGPGDLRGPVSICGLVVECGDLVICDEDGVAVIPLAQAEQVIAAAEAKMAAEMTEESQIRQGTWDRTWLDRMLTLRDAPSADRMPSAERNVG
ncbi:RraA family protein [Paracoccus sp. (in: a-proteobacteria)]|uniref:RraA family protein n=1 Tax=Paracoccus sp. TaxID=267 RepID=UPI003342D832